MATMSERKESEITGTLHLRGGALSRLRAEVELGGR